MIKNSVFILALLFLTLPARALASHFDTRLVEAKKLLKQLGPHGSKVVNDLEKMSSSVTIIERDMAGVQRGETNCPDEKCTITVSRNASVVQLAEIIAHEIKHVEDVISLQPHRKKIEDVWRSKVRSAETCLRQKKNIDLCGMLHGAKPVWFSIMSHYFPEYHAYKTHLSLYSEGLRSHLFFVRVNGKREMLGARPELLAQYATVSLKITLGISLNHSQMKGLVRAIDYYPNLWEIYRTYYPEVDASASPSNDSNPRLFLGT